jgi:hypothetical protein
MKPEMKIVKGYIPMRNGIEKRLHRVMIKIDKKDVICPYAKTCISAENCNRCNQFYRKCSKFIAFIRDSK